MRLVVCALGAVGVSAISLALADPPATPAAPPAATQAPASSPAAAPAPSTSAPSAAAKDTKPTDPVVVQGTAEMDNLEKHFLSEGYKMEMRNGQKVFCRREEVLGSRLGAQKVCSSAQQLQANEREAQAAYQRGQTQQNNPSGR